MHIAASFASSENMNATTRISISPSRTRLISTCVKNWLIVSVSLDSFVTRLPI
ncbi:hypothetical protein D3C84_1029040 [compost metagenome]